MRKALHAFLALVVASILFSLGACSSPGGILTSDELTAAQNGAGVILTVVKTEAALYTSTAGISASDAAKVNTAVAALTLAVSDFQGLSSLGNVNADVTALLNTTTAVLNLLPGLSSDEKEQITAALTLVEMLLPVVLPAPIVPPNSIAPPSTLTPVPHPGLIAAPAASLTSGS